jgi:hypothetical protein
MKRILQAAVVAMSMSAAAAYAQQTEMVQANDRIEVAQASTGAERGAVQREASRKPSMYEISGLAGEGSFPSRGGPLDD